jgi:hypothetical protein
MKVFAGYIDPDGTENKTSGWSDTGAYPTCKRKEVKGFESMITT